MSQPITPGHQTRRERVEATEARLRELLAEHHESPGAWLRDLLADHPHGIGVDAARTAVLRLLPRYERDSEAGNAVVLDALAELAAAGDAHLAQYASTSMIRPGRRPDRDAGPNWQPVEAKPATAPVDKARLAQLADGIRNRRERSAAAADRAAATSERVRAQGERAKGLVERVRANRDAKGERVYDMNTGQHRTIRRPS